MQGLEENGQRAVIPEPKRQARKWEEGQEAERAAVESTCERVASDEGRELLRQRSEEVERSMAHMYETGGMRRVYLRGHDNILKRLLHACGYNLGVLMRPLTGVGTPSLQGQRSAGVLARNGLENALSGVKSAKCIVQRQTWRRTLHDSGFHIRYGEKPTQISC